MVSTFISESGWLINIRLAEVHINSNQLMRIATRIKAPPISKGFLAPVFLWIANSTVQMVLDSRFVMKPAPRTDNEVLIKSVAVMRRSVTPRINTT